MLLRKLVAIFCPSLLCLLTCILFRWLDGIMESGSFFLYLIKGLLLGACLSLLLPVAGISTRNNGLLPYLYGAAGVIALFVLYQYLETIRVVHWAALKALISINGQVILAESAVMGFLLTTALLQRKK